MIRLRPLLAALLACTVSAAVLPAQPLSPYYGTLSSLSPRFNSPNFGVPPVNTADVPRDDDPENLSSFFYDAFSFRALLDGMVTFNSSAVDPGSFLEPVLFLYQGGFDPSNPLSNLLFGATASATDPEFGENPGLPYPFMLQAGQNYTLVTSAVFFDATGDFVNTIECASTAACVAALDDVSVVPEPASVALTAFGLLLIGGAARARRRG